MIAFIQYSTHGKLTQFAFDRDPHTCASVLQSALRGGMELDRVQVKRGENRARYVEFAFIEDTGARRIPHGASVEFHDWDEIEQQFVREMFRAFGAEEVNA